MRSRRTPIESTPPIGRLADRQYGVVARRQLVAMGIGNRAIDRRLSRRSLILLHRGVYAAGHRRLRQEGRWLAAVLAAGPGAVLSHRDAAALHGMRPTPVGKVSVSTPAHARSIDGVWVKARRTLTEDERMVVRGIPVTTPARTLVDLAGMLTAGQLQSTLGEADRRGLLDIAAVERALARTGPAPQVTPPPRRPRCPCNSGARSRVGAEGALPRSSHIADLPRRCPQRAAAGSGRPWPAGAWTSRWTSGTRRTATACGTVRRTYRLQLHGFRPPRHARRSRLPPGRGPRSDPKRCARHHRHRHSRALTPPSRR